MTQIPSFCIGDHRGDKDNMDILESLCGSSLYTNDAAKTSSLTLSVVVTQAETSLILVKSDLDDL